MNTITLHTLILLIRSLSNEITTKMLASKLGVSCSTIARTKNGIWSPSITPNALKRAFGDYQQQYFKGSDSDFVSYICEFMIRRGIDVRQIPDYEKSWNSYTLLKKLAWHAEHNSERLLCSRSSCEDTADSHPSSLAMESTRMNGGVLDLRSIIEQCIAENLGKTTRFSVTVDVQIAFHPVPPAPIEETST